MARFNMLSGECPMCGTRSVVKIDGNWNFRSASHRCTNCDAKLRTVFTPEALWAGPSVVIAGVAMYFLITWLRQSQLVSGGVLAGLIGGLSGAVFAGSARVAFRGIVFRAWSA